MNPNAEEPRRKPGKASGLTRRVELILSLGALVISGISLASALITANTEAQQYADLTVPHTAFEETRDMILSLDSRISSARMDISSGRQSGLNTTAWEENLTAAVALRNRANTAWLAGNYTQAQALIIESSAALDNIPITVGAESGSSEALSLGSMAVAIAAVLYVTIVQRRWARMPPPR